MIDAKNYQIVYLLFVSCITFFTFLQYYNNDTRKKNDITPIIVLVLSIYIGCRPVDRIFYDTVGYANVVDGVYGNIFNYNILSNFLFNAISELFYLLNLGHTLYFIFIAFLYFCFRYISCKKMFPENIFCGFAIFLGSLTTFAYSVNTIKAGVAFSLFCCAVAYRKQILLSILFLLLSYGFHHSMYVCILAFICTSFYKNTKIYLFIWVISLFIAVMHISFFQNLFLSFSSEKAAEYLKAEDGWITGMRYDLVLYSLIPIILGWYIIFIKKYMIGDFKFIYNIYVLLNSLWLLCMYTSFTDRIAGLSWMFYPIILAYPFLNSRYFSNRAIANVMVGHLGFTLFMHFVYYSKVL